MFCSGKNIGVGIIYNRAKAIYLNGLDNPLICKAIIVWVEEKFSGLCTAPVVYLYGTHSW